MRTRFYLYMFLWCCIASTEVQAKNYRTATQQKRWDKAFSIRMSILEQHYGISFDKSWRPRVTFGSPPFAQDLASVAWYVPSTEKIYISKRLQSYLPNLKHCRSDLPAFGDLATDRDVIRETIDHELGHRFTDDVRKKLGKRSWLTDVAWQAMPSEDRVGARMIIEGIGNYYGSTSHVSDGILQPLNGLSVLPRSLYDSAWGDTDFRYEGGAWLVEPILECYGEEGLVYLLTHCMSFSNGDVRSAAIAYQQQALSDLANGQP